jgi:hypothetical protein
MQQVGASGSPSQSLSGSPRHSLAPPASPTSQFFASWAPTAVIAEKRTLYEFNLLFSLSVLPGPPLIDMVVYVFSVGRRPATLETYQSASSRPTRGGYSLLYRIYVEICGGRKFRENFEAQNPHIAWYFQHVKFKTTFLFLRSPLLEAYEQYVCEKVTKAFKKVLPLCTFLDYCGSS